MISGFSARVLFIAWHVSHASRVLSVFLKSFTWRIVSRSNDDRKCNTITFFINFDFSCFQIERCSEACDTPVKVSPRQYSTIASLK